MLFVATYNFLLRMPSEAIVMTKGDGQGNEDTQSVVWLDEEDHALVLKLKKRKNKLGGSLLKRHCWCDRCKTTCPVHKFANLLVSEQIPVGAKLFPRVTKGKALKNLRTWLKACGVQDSEKYRTQDLRRGHARDLQQAGESH